MLKRRAASAGFFSQIWDNKMGYIAPLSPTKDFLAYKYLISIDGMGISSSLDWQLFSTSVVLKQASDFVNWYSDALIPYVHYIPLASNLSDLEETIVWLISHDNDAKTIASQGHIFAKENLSDAQAMTYLYHLIIAYAQFFSEDASSTHVYNTGIK